MNKFICMGYVSNDPEISETSNGMKIAKYRIGVKKKDGYDNFNCVAFRNNADFAERYIKKGSHMLFEGSISTGSYTNKDGNKVYTFDFIVNSQEFAESKNASQGINDTPKEEKAVQKTMDDFMAIPDSVSDAGLPFN